MFSPSSSILQFSLTFYCLARAWLLLLGWWSCYRGSLPHLLVAAPRIATAIKQQLANIYIILCNTAHGNTAPRHGTAHCNSLFIHITFTLTILHCWQRIVLTSRKIESFSNIFWRCMEFAEVSTSLNCVLKTTNFLRCLLGPHFAQCLRISFTHFWRGVVLSGVK